MPSLALKNKRRRQKRRAQRQAVEQAVERAVEQAVEQVAGPIAEQAAEQAYDVSEEEESDDDDGKISEAMENLLRNKAEVTARLDKFKEALVKQQANLTTAEQDLRQRQQVENDMVSYYRAIRQNSEKIKRVMTEIASLNKQKQKILDKVKERCELRGEPVRQSNAATDKIDDEIHAYKQQIDQLTAENDKHQRVVDTTSYGNMRSSRQSVAANQRLVKGSQKTITGQKKKLDLIQRLIEEERWRPRYLKYARMYELEYEQDEDTSLFKVCNHHRHMQNCEGHYTYTKCGKSYRECSEDVVLTVDYDDVRGSCECGHFQWESEDPPDDLREFNLDSHDVYGSMAS